MQDRHVRQIMSVIRSIARLPPNAEERLQSSLLTLQLKPGPEPYLGSKRDPKSLWISEAREWARNHALKNDWVSTQDILDEIPPAPGVDIRAVGGVFKSKEWTRIGDIRVKGEDGRYKFVGKFALVNQTDALPSRGAVTDW